MIFKHEINMNLANEGFRVVSLESPQTGDNYAKTDAKTDSKTDSTNDCGNSSIYHSLSTLDQCLSDADCQEFMDGLENTIHDGELLYEHVTDFTAKILRKWGVQS